MITLLSHFFIKNGNSYQDPEVRRQYGSLCGIVGIALNIFLFVLKWIAGFISGSVAITADAFNNLSDAGSSIITLVGFQLSGQKPDAEHPYGHGRMEYLSGLLVAVAILLMGCELAQSSFSKILHPAPVQSGLLVYAILGISILTKVYMYFYNHSTARKIDSTTMEATAKDSLSDTISTSIVLIATIIGATTGVLLDGWLGILVSLFILYAGITTLRETITPLLGQPPKKEFVDRIESLVMASPSVIGIHDLLVHDYGPGRCMISLHAEVSAHSDLLAIHDEIDNIERTLEKELHCSATIHMDPIVTDDEETTRLYKTVRAIAHDYLPELSIHDFRIVRGTTHTNLIFDVLIPYGAKYSDKEIKAYLQKKISEIPGSTYYAVICVDHTYV